MLKLSLTGCAAAMALMLPTLVWADAHTNYPHYPHFPVEQSLQAGQLERSVFKVKGDISPTKAKSSSRPLGLRVNMTPATSAYGRRLHPISKRYKLHQGDDYAAPHGTPIMAPADGVVSFKGRKGGYGNTVMLHHGNGMETLYAHMSRFPKNMAVGKVVETGDVIGFVGSTGQSTGPHLHFEVHVNDRRVNPSSVNLPKQRLSEQELNNLRLQVQPNDSGVKTIRL